MLFQNRNPYLKFLKGFIYGALFAVNSDEHYYDFFFG